MTGKGHEIVCLLGVILLSLYDEDIDVFIYET